MPPTGHRGLQRRRLGARLIAADLLALGITVDCLPLADVPVAGADAVIGDRAYGTDPATVAALGRAVAEGLAEGGVLPVLKHIPGHGRATADSHHRLPVVETPRAELENDRFRGFPAACRPADGDDGPCCVQRARCHATGHDFCDNHLASDSSGIGFHGLLMSDDLSMNALRGRCASAAPRASRRVATCSCIATASSTR